MIRLPGVCIVCRAPVEWTGKRWRDAGRRGMGRHHCREERPVCGAWMPLARERCARRPGHGWQHTTAYALENAARARRQGTAA